MFRRIGEFVFDNLISKMIDEVYIDNKEHVNSHERKDQMIVSKHNKLFAIHLRVYEVGKEDFEPKYEWVRE